MAGLDPNEACEQEFIYKFVSELAESGRGV